MPFFYREHALLGARRACSQTQYVTFWLLVGYELYQRRLHPLILRIVCSVICKVFLRSELGCMEGDEEFFLHRAHAGPSPNPSPAGRGVICEVTPTGLLTRFLGSSFSHRVHRVHWAFWRTVSSPQKAFGIQSAQSVTAKGGCKVLWNRLT